MPAGLEYPYERITYRDGQLLAHRDLQDDKDGHDRLRWLHTQYLHATWGVALGLEIQASMGEAVVQVHPGLAVDDCGREIVLSTTIRVVVPNLPFVVNLVLTVSHARDAEFRAAGAERAVCTADGPDPRAERPAFWWRRPREVRFGREIPLVSVTTLAGLVRAPLDFRVRRNARRLARPYMVCGTTEPGQTGWTQEAEPNTGHLYLQVDVDTSEAAFTKVPQYFAVLTGDFRGLPGPSFSQPAACFAAPCAFILDARQRGFTYRILPGRRLPLGLPILPKEAETRKLAVSWLGVEPLAGCPPPPKPLPYNLLSAFRSFMSEAKP